MSATELRKAAEVLRERASKAVAPPWGLIWDSCDCGDGYGCSHGSWVHAIRFPVPVQEPMRPCGEVMPHHHEAGVDEIPPETVEYMVTMHPGVGLALAKWLDDIAAGWMWDGEEPGVVDLDGDPLTFEESLDTHALTIALLINGGAA